MAETQLLRLSIFPAAGISRDAAFALEVAGFAAAGVSAPASPPTIWTGRPRLGAATLAGAQKTKGV